MDSDRPFPAAGMDSDRPFPAADMDSVHPFPVAELDNTESSAEFLYQIPADPAADSLSAAMSADSDILASSAVPADK